MKLFKKGNRYKMMHNNIVIYFDNACLIKDDEIEIGRKGESICHLTGCAKECFKNKAEEIGLKVKDIR